MENPFVSKRSGFLANGYNRRNRVRIKDLTLSEQISILPYKVGEELPAISMCTYQGIVQEDGAVIGAREDYFGFPEEIAVSGGEFRAEEIVARKPKYYYNCVRPLEGSDVADGEDRI